MDARIREHDKPGVQNRFRFFLPFIHPIIFMAINDVMDIGAGTMGNGIAHVFAQNGFNVTLVDVDEARIEAGVSTITKNLDRQVKKEAISEADRDATLGRIARATDIRSAAPNADLIIEAATENPALKAEIFRTLDAAA